jgi:hypothetical protein
MPTFTRNGVPMAYGPFFDGGINYPANALDLWSDAALAQVGVVRHADPAPEPVRPELPKDVVIQRLIYIDKASAVMALLKADDGLFALWFAPSWPNVYKDDERVLNLLYAAGLDADEVAQVMA